MKAAFITIMASLLAICVCAQDKAYRPEVSKMLVDNGTPLIVKGNGDTVKGKNVSLPPLLHAREKWIKFDDGKISTDGIIALQDGKAFYGKFEYDSSFMWVKQIRRGKINLFYYEQQHPTGFATPWGSSKYDSPIYFVVQKGNEPLHTARESDVAARLKDNNAAYEKFIRQFGGEEKNGLPKAMAKHSNVLLEVIDIYNNGN